MIDVPATTLMGLVLKASGNAQGLASSWVRHAEQEVKDLLPTAAINEVMEDDMVEIEAADTAAVINPLTSSATAAQRYVGYLPIKIGDAPELYWALADTGAQVSVITAGLAHYLDLHLPDMSNVTPASFAVSGYNGTASYMPII